MGIIVYLIIGVALLTFSSVKQYQRNKEEFIETKFRYWLWWVVTLGCALLWPVLVASCIYDAVCIVRDIKEQG